MHYQFYRIKKYYLYFFVFVTSTLLNINNTLIFTHDQKKIVEYQDEDYTETVLDTERESIHNKINDFEQYYHQQDNTVQGKNYNGKENLYLNDFKSYVEMKNQNNSPLRNEILVQEKANLDSNNEFEIHSIIEDYVDPKILNNYSNKERTPLALTQKDIRFEKGTKEEYYDLIIRKKKGINSVLLTNYYWSDQKGKVREYGLRSLQFNNVNGNEKRLFRKIFIGSEQGLYFLVDSTPEYDKYFGLAFRLRIPKYVVYGYRKSKEIYGVLRIKDGMKLNVRSFSRKFADYKGTYQENPIALMLNNRPLYIKDRPVVRKIKEVLGEQYIGVYIEYESKEDFFKNFLVREDKEKTFAPITFNNSSKEDRQAVLLEAYYKDGIGKILKAVIYFKRVQIPRTFYVTAVDKNKLQAVGHISVQVPAYYYDLQDAEEYQYKNQWHDEDILKN